MTSCRVATGGFKDMLNPMWPMWQVFGDIMIDYSYVECSSSAMQANWNAAGICIGCFREFSQLNISCFSGGEMVILGRHSSDHSNVVQALMLFTEQFPKHRAREIARAVQRGARFIESMMLGSSGNMWEVFSVSRFGSQDS